jgi:helicase MOV-10
MVEHRICKYYLSEAGCRARLGCRFRHDVFKCPCGVLVLYSSKREHEKGKKHRHLMQQQQRQTGVPSGAAAAEEKEDEATIVMPEEDRSEKCSRCQWVIFAKDMDGHTAAHDRQDRIRQMEEELAKAEQDKEDITVDPKDGIHFGVVELEAGTAEEIKVNIRRIGGQGPSVRLINCYMRSSLDGSTSP